MSTWTDKEPYPAKFVPRLLADTWNRYQAKEKPVSVGKDRFPVFAGNPYRAEHLLISKFLAETWSLLEWNLEPKNYASGRAILELEDPAKGRVIMALVERYPWLWKICVRPAAFFSGGPKGYSYNLPTGRMHIIALLKAVLRSTTNIPPEQFAKLLTAASEPPNRELLWEVKPKTLVRLAASMWPNGGIPDAVNEKLTALEKFLGAPTYQRTADERKLIQDLRALLGRAASPVILPGEAWSDAALADLKKMSGPEAAKWLGLLTHCQKADGSKPTQKWAKAAVELVDEIGRESFKARALTWFEQVALPRTNPKPPPRYESQPDPNQLLEESNVTVLRGLVWCLAGWKDADVSSALSTLAEVCFKKVRWLGPRCPRVGNACLYSLAATSSDDAAAQLSRLDSTVKQPTAKKRIGKSLDAAASLTGQTREELEEKSIPTFGLSMDGALSQTFGDAMAKLQVVESRDVEVSWSRKGKELKSAPAEVKRDHGKEFKDFQKLVKDIEKMLAAQRIRVERLLMTERDWNFESWRKRYFEHPLLANITRRLIWHFKLGDKTTLGSFLNGKLVDVQDRPIAWLKPETRVRLWHPIGFALETVAAWRDWLQKHEVCQPFKQAYREIYILTDAELRTATYSNRFAAHILGQHQFAALCKQRGWKYQFMGGFDFQSTPTLELPAWNLAAEFWVQPAGELAGSGVARFLTTDQVRFVRNEEALPLTEVPATVFSEVMRDVDLFVGVGSVGNDPAWRDSGEVEGGGDYWPRYSFGDLTATAQTRRDVLKRLLPKLKIASQCALEEKFLRVKGDVRTYRIHLGSGNIQMEPNAQYLCIVPNQGAASKTSESYFLPFEGDRVLSIILSKAFLLADDSKIKDPSITSQIKTH